MKKGFLVLVLMVFGWVGSASAVTITDTFEVNQKIDTFQSVSWAHNFDFDPAVESINSASLTVLLKDDERDSKWNIFSFEFGISHTEGYGWQYLGEINSGKYSLGVDLPSLMDGSYGVTVKSLWGDFWVKSSTLVVDYNPVSEPGTLLLLGAGLVGLALYRRRSMNK